MSRRGAWGTGHGGAGPRQRSRGGRRVWAVGAARRWLPAAAARARRRPLLTAALCPWPGLPLPLGRRSIHALGVQRALVFMNFQQRLKDTGAPPRPWEGAREGGGLAGVGEGWGC